MLFILYQLFIVSVLSETCYNETVYTTPHQVGRFTDTKIRSIYGETGLVIFPGCLEEYIGLNNNYYIYPTDPNVSFDMIYKDEPIQYFYAFKTFYVYPNSTQIFLSLSNKFSNIIFEVFYNVSSLKQVEVNKNDVMTEIIFKSNDSMFSVNFLNNASGYTLDGDYVSNVPVYLKMYKENKHGGILQRITFSYDIADDNRILHFISIREYFDKEKDDKNKDNSKLYKLLALLFMALIIIVLIAIFVYKFLKFYGTVKNPTELMTFIRR